MYWLVGATVLLWLVWNRSKKADLSKIPTIGPDGFLLSYWGAFKFILNAQSMIQEGYDKYKGAPFKIANFNRWIVFVSRPTLVEEFRKAGEHELSMVQAIVEDFAVDYTLGSSSHLDPYHVPVVRNQLTKNLGVLFPHLRDEVAQTFDDFIPTTKEWTKVCASAVITQMVVRISNRLFVGAPLCRDPEWIALNAEFPIDVVKAAAIINFFPNFLKPLAGRLLTNVHAKTRRAMRRLVPIIEDRQRHIDEYGEEWDNRPNDLLSWLMDAARGEEQSPQNLTMRILVVNFAAIHTTSMSFTHALYFLAANPQYLQPLRDEADAVVRREGWSKAALGHMRRVDSFLKETQRHTGLGCVSMTRIAMKDYTFADGTRVPRGAGVAVPTLAIHRDEEHYARAGAFDGFRFAGVGEGLSEGESTKLLMVATNLNYLAFGHGPHACPGRFFASTELKAMLAHLVITYDIALAPAVDGTGTSERPKDIWFGVSCIPNPSAEVLFRRRQS